MGELLTKLFLAFSSRIGDMFSLDPHTQHILGSLKSFPMHMKQYQSPSGILSNVEKTKGLRELRKKQEKETRASLRFKLRLKAIRMAPTIAIVA